MFLTCWYLDISTSPRSVFDVYPEARSFDEGVRQLVFLDEKNKDEQNKSRKGTTMRVHLDILTDMDVLMGGLD